MPSPTPRNPNLPYQQRVWLPGLDYQAVTSDVTIKLYVIRGRSIRVDRVWLSVPAGIAANAANFVSFRLIKGTSTVIASWSTAPTAQGTIAAGGDVDLVLGTLADRHLADGDRLSLIIDVTGTITVPAGRLVADGLEL